MKRLQILGALVLAILLATGPAWAAAPPDRGAAGWSWFAPLLDALGFGARAAASADAEDAGPRMEPNGFAAPPAGSAGQDAGPNMEPDG